MQWFSNVFHPCLFESVGVEPLETEGEPTVVLNMEVIYQANL
jgi:hypothetical protein